MAFIDIVLRQPTYGWQDEKGNLIKPSKRQIWAEFLSRINIFQSRKNWLASLAWFWMILLLPFLYLFLFRYFTWALFAAGFIYSMVFMGTYGTIWHHRYCTHGAYIFKNKFWRLITQNLVIRMVPEEIYVISHHVHHVKSDKPGDPYNAYGGWLYCFLADANHQPVATNLSEGDYNRAAVLLETTGTIRNNYAQYQKWGSVSNPYYAILTWLLNWTFWYVAFFLIGGHALACTLFGSALIWAVGVRTFNFEGHGKGKDRRKEGFDFSANDMSVNQYWPGFVAGEWHSNHHLFPASARAGFLPFQVDFAWIYIYCLHKIGGISSFHNSKKQFYENHYLPYLRSMKQK
jgi:sn-1 stearoyl-lipid 9-desaturase